MYSRWPVYERVLVNLVDGSAIDGLLTRKTGPLIVLADSTLYTAAGQPQRLDGDVYIERHRVLYMQAVPARTPAAE